MWALDAGWIAPGDAEVSQWTDAEGRAWEQKRWQVAPRAWNFTLAINGVVTIIGFDEEPDTDSLFSAFRRFDDDKADSFPSKMGVVQNVIARTAEPKRRNPIRKPRYGTKSNRWGS